MSNYLLFTPDIHFCRAANLAFLKPDFEILAFFERLWLFLGNKKSLTKSGFFWLFFSRKGLDLEKHCQSCIHYKSLLKEYADCAEY